MIRFRCSRCGKALKVPEGKAGVAVVCPRCEGRCVTPAAAFVTDPEGRAPGPEGGGAVAHQHPDQAPSLFSGMSLGLRCVVAGVVGLAALTPLLAVVGPQVPALAKGTVLN